VREVYIDDDTKEATVVVPDDQLALAIGKEGLNARLAARLTGWKVDIQSDTEFAQAEAEAAFAGEDDTEEFSGRCAALLSNGKRCPNAALPGSKYCGVPAHQALTGTESDEPAIVQVEAAIEDVTAETVSDDLEVGAEGLAEVDEAHAAGVLTPADADAAAAAIVDATADAVAQDVEAAEQLEAILEAEDDELQAVVEAEEIAAATGGEEGSDHGRESA
jgi:N utilization substance protein A